MWAGRSSWRFCSLVLNCGRRRIIHENFYMIFANRWKRKMSDTMHKILETGGWASGHRRLSVFFLSNSKTFQPDIFPMLHVRFNLLSLKCFLLTLKLCRWETKCLLRFHRLHQIRWMLDLFTNFSKSIKCNHNLNLLKMFTNT